MNQPAIRRRYAALMAMLEGDRRDYAVMLQRAVVRQAAQRRRARDNATRAERHRRNYRLLRMAGVSVEDAQVQRKKRLTFPEVGNTVPT